MLLSVAITCALLTNPSGWETRGRGTWEYVSANGHTAALFTGYAADPGDGLVTVVSFDREGNPSFVDRLWYAGLDDTGLSIIRLSFSPTEAMKAAYRKHLTTTFKADSNPRQAAAITALTGIGADPDRSEFRLPRPPVVYRLRVMGLTLANFETDRGEGHLRIQITVVRDTTIVASLATSQ
jgi:hypothetical protein